MAIYHFSSSVISRSQGRSAVASAAYRSAAELHDIKYGKTHDYTQKQDVAFSEILLPENAPEWMQDREQLWNAVEGVEKRKDAQLAREIQFALPRELTTEQNILLAREFIRQEFVDRGMVADWALHVDKGQDGKPQPHVHVMLTFRAVNAGGFGQKVREWNNKEHLLQWREVWAETANRHLAMHGHDMTIDHRSYAEQGIALEPQHKIGTTAAREQMARLADHQRIAQANGERIFADPEIALDALTRQQSTFTHHDLARFVNRHTVDDEQFQRVYEKIKADERMVALGHDGQGRERFTTKAMLALEQRMVDHTQAMLVRDDAHAVSEKHQTQALANCQLSEQQREAFSHLVAGGDIKCVVGYAGTGKSYLLGTAREAWEAEGYRVHGVTLSGIAAQNLEASSGIESRTLASRQYYWDRGEERLTGYDVLVIDEAGMFGSRQMEQLLHEAQTQGAKVVLVGDPQQLQAIEAGAAFRAITEQAHYVELTEIRRQREMWQQEATRELAQGNVSDAMARYATHDHVHEFVTQAEAKRAVIDLWNDARLSQPQETQIMLAYIRKDVQELNEMARDIRQELGELGKDHRLMTARGERAFAQGDRIYFLRNDRELGVYNGTLGTIERVEDRQLTIRIDANDLHEARSVNVDINRYNELDHGYAATIHKAQGVTVDRTYILASKYLDAHATYVGMSRHRESADICWSQEEFAHERALNKTLGRDRSKDVTLDYSLQGSFAEQRGIHVSELLREQVKPDLSPDIEKVDVKRDLFHDLGFTREEAEKFAAREAELHACQQQDMEDFKQFVQQFEKDNPALVKHLKQEIVPEREKCAVAIEQIFERLNQRLEENPYDHAAKRELTQLAAHVAKDEYVTAHIKEHKPNLEKQLEQLQKTRQKESPELELELSL